MQTNYSSASVVGTAVPLLKNAKWTGHSVTFGFIRSADAEEIRRVEMRMKCRAY